MDMLVEDRISVDKRSAVYSLPEGVAKLEQRIDADGNVYTRVYKKPDADFYNAISMEEFRRRCHIMLDRLDKEYFG